MPTLVVDDKQLDYSVRVSKRMRRRAMNITVSPKRIEVAVGSHVPSEAIKSFVKQKQEWIFSHWKEQRRNAREQALKLPRSFKNGVTMPYRGHMYPIKIRHNGLKLCEVQFDGKVIIITLRKALPKYKHQETIRKAMKDWFKTQLTADVKHLFTKYGLLLRRLPKSYRIKQQRTLWGSCSHKGNININFALIFTPFDVLEYLVVHELCHLKHPDHSSRFWREVERLLPGYEEPKGWLKSHGYLLDFTL